MNKKFLQSLCLTLATMMSVSTFAGCGGNQGDGGVDTNTAEWRNENKVLVFSSGEFDGVFNPFFGTSAYDTSITGQTQISMISADDTGNNVTFGRDEPVVTLDYNETMYDTYGDVTTTGDEDGTTVYQFVLKNNILFSDGQPLTAHDVLFNMYVYLDPNYMGSSTMYSTDIKGLKSYQQQVEDEMTEEQVAALEQKFMVWAGLRINAIKAYVNEETNWETLAGLYEDSYNDFVDGGNKVYGETEIKADIARIRELWNEEIVRDWNAAGAGLESMKEEYPFGDSQWQLYFYNAGLISRKKDPAYPNAEVFMKDANGKWIIEWAGYDPNAEYTKEEAIAELKSAFGADEYVATILDFWVSGSDARNEFAAEDKGLYYESLKGEDGELAIKSIEGIKIKSGADFKGTKKYDEDYSQYDMLEITINGVDPKAKWNFAFAVAPMHYYSTPELTAAAMADTNYESNFGVEYCSVDFMNTLKRRNSVPMGAGMYQATTMYDYKYDWSNDAASFAKLADAEEGFWSKNLCYFIRNDNFVTTGGNEHAVHNAKIKHVQYKVVNSAQTMTALRSGAIHFADPSATTENIEIIENHGDLDRIMLETSGYGYIGINAKYVKNINVRRAIMSAMDISLVQNYYPGDLSEPIYRSFSKVSWVYNEFPDDFVDAWHPVSSDGNADEQYYPYYGDDNNYTAVKEAVIYYLQEGGCQSRGGKWYDENGELLKYTFTVAGDTTDHPAYKTFLKARDILNSIGMEIEVIPDSRALYKLASGSLAIWAAAWSAGLDPDMYQVYHKNSKATSTLNWGYDWIKTDGTSEEKSLIEQISGLIDDGRSTINAADRTRYYREASDLVMQLAVELPVYQRSDMNVYNNKVLDATTFKKNPTPFSGVLSEMWKVSFL